MHFFGRKFIGLSSSILLAAQLAIGPFVCLSPAQACGPFFDDTLFSGYCHPNLPLSFYARGALGVVQPTYARSYQIVAYRYLSGKPLNASEQKAFLDFWHSRLSGNGYAVQDDSKFSSGWLADRNKILGVSGKKDQSISVFRNSSADGWSMYLNCPADAFKTASATLARIVSKYGADSAVCKEWIKGQDAVFCHCAGPSYNYRTNKTDPEPDFPQKLPESAPLEVRQDRQYQLAAAYFYAQKLDDALTLFTAISQDKTSPWQHIGEYMVARTLVRKGTLNKAKGVDTEYLGRAMKALKKLAEDPSYSSFKSSIDDLIAFTRVRLDPIGACHDLGKELSSPSPAPDLQRRIDDYIFVLDSLFNPDADPYGDPPDRNLKIADARVGKAIREDDLTDWIWCFSSIEPSELAHAAERFKATGNIPWTVAYASKLKGTEPQAGQVLAALAKVSKTDPAFVTTSYHRARMLYAAGKGQEAEDVIAAALASSNLSPSAANDLSLLKLEHASSLDQFFKLSFRAPYAIVGGSDSQELPDNFDKVESATSFPKLAPVLLPKAAEAINGSFPLAHFVAGASSASVPTPYQAQFVQAAFTRAVMLKDYATALKLTAAMKKSYPNLVKCMTDFEKAGSDEDREFAAACAILRCPGMRPSVTGGTGRGTAFAQIDDFQDNWWSEDTIVGSGDRGGNMQDTTDKTALPTPFLSASDRSQAKAQLAKLKATGQAPNYLGKIVIAYAKAHPADPRVPEALAMTVKATRFGSSDESKTTAVSTQAFQILHKKYPTNPFTKKTPYHY